MRWNTTSDFACAAMIGIDWKGRRFERTVEDFHARVVQHECDHLEGILYPMRIRDLAKFGFNEALFPGQDLPAEE